MIGQVTESSSLTFRREQLLDLQGRIAGNRIRAYIDSSPARVDNQNLVALLLTTSENTTYQQHRRQTFKFLPALVWVTQKLKLASPSVTKWTLACPSGVSGTMFARTAAVRS